MEMTVELLEEKFGDNIEDAVDFLSDTLPKRPEKPKKPSNAMFGGNVKSEVVLQYVNDLKAYEEVKAEYDILMHTYQKERYVMEKIFLEYIKEISGFNSVVPAQYQEKTWVFIYDRRHDEGFASLYYFTLEIINIFG